MRHIIIDTETTGFGVQRGGRVIEIGAVVVENGVVIEEFSSLINSGAAISYFAFKVHGISEEMLLGKPEPDDVWAEFHKFIGDAELIAHNAPFDSAFVRHELALAGFELQNPWHCTVRLARKMLPELHNHKLDTIYRHFFGEIPASMQRHRALDDARMTARIWAELNR